LRIKHIEIRNFRGIKFLSWPVKGNFNCIIGPGDTCKTTILLALDYALAPRTALAFDDSDFFNQDVSQDIVIQVTLADWDETQPPIKKFFQESKFAQYKCGLADTGPVPEPQSGGTVALSISLRIDKSLEPKWSVTRGRDERDEQDRKPIYATDRAVLGLSRLDNSSDIHFTWARNTILTRLSADSTSNLGTVLSTLSREVRQSDVSQHESIMKCQAVADTIKQEAQNTGVKLMGLSPKIDLQRQSLSAGAVSLHEDNVPLRNKGSGSKKLIAGVMQMKLHDGKNISLIDEIELGLEPHRIRGLLYKLKKSQQQIFTTTHSPVVLRELSVADSELHACKRTATGTVSLQSLGTIPAIQGPVRANAEAFLGSKIVACEGPTEIGCLRAYDIHRFDENNPSIWSLATSYFNCGGIGSIKLVCPQLIQLGYRTAVLCDNDAPEQLSVQDVENLRDAGAYVCQWDNNNSTEHQLFADLPWQHIPALLTTISESHDTLELATIVDSVRKEPRIAEQRLDDDPASWPESQLLRRVLGDLAHSGRWIKRIDYAEASFRLALPLLPDTSTIPLQLSALWTWIQRNE
jgi:energy-coupling factor transporter ATP-binding protein EcfA2